MNGDGLDFNPEARAFERDLRHFYFSDTHWNAISVGKYHLPVLKVHFTKAWKLLHRVISYNRV